MWMSIAAGIWLTSRAFHITFPYPGSFLVTTVLIVGVAAPTPGGLGAFHAAYQFAVMEFFAASFDRAVGAAIVLHALSFVPVTLLGLAFMAREGLTFGRAKEIAHEVLGARVRTSSGSHAAARERRAMKCPYCGHLGDKVVDSRESKEGDVIRRRRQCLNCGKRFTSRERLEDIEYRVVKKDGNREAFQRQKLIAGLLTASEKRPVSIQQLEAIADRVEAELQERPEREMTTEEIGARLMQELKQLDQIAYVRFASVYRQFRDVGQFKREVDELQKSKG